jgi:hypothetical protein
MAADEGQIGHEAAASIFRDCKGAMLAEIKQAEKNRRHEAGQDSQIPMCFLDAEPD